jgi:hypothetical protein
MVYDEKSVYHVIEVAKEKPGPSTELQHYVIIRQLGQWWGRGLTAGYLPSLKNFSLYIFFFSHLTISKSLFLY